MSDLNTFLESEESSTSSEDDEGELLTAEIDMQIQETIRALRNKDPKIYDKNHKFIQDVPGTITKNHQFFAFSNSHFLNSRPKIQTSKKFF